MTDCFIRTLDYRREKLPHAELRFKMAELCRGLWEQYPVNLHVLFGEGQKFQRESRIQAERRAKSPIYILTDDDCAVLELDLPKILEVMANHPDFAQLSLWPSNCTIQPWTEGIVNTDVMEHVSVGGVRFCRKESASYWPPMNGNGYDRIHADWFRENGMRVGYLRNHAMIHLGERRSVTW